MSHKRPMLHALFRAPLRVGTIYVFACATVLFIPSIGLAGSDNTWARSFGQVALIVVGGIVGGYLAFVATARLVQQILREELGNSTTAENEAELAKSWRQTLDRAEATVRNYPALIAVIVAALAVLALIVQALGVILDRG